MYRGKLCIFKHLMAFGMGALLLCSTSVSAEFGVSNPAAGTDDLDPGPVSAVMAVVDLAGPDVTVSWALSDDDFVRQTAASMDFTSGGVFVNVNDVAGYKVWRDDGGAAGAQVLETLGRGETSYVDEAVVNGVFYTYSITAIDAAGNESDAVAADQVLVGSAPKPDVTPDEPEDEDTEIVQSRKIAVNVETSQEDEALLLDTDPNNQEAVEKQNEVKEQAIDAFLAKVNEGRAVPLKRNQVSVSFEEGSIVIVFEIVDDPEDEEAPTAAEAAEAFEVLLEEEPEVLVEQIDVVEEVVEFSSTALVDVDFGTLLEDETASQSFTFTNNATADDALLFLSISVAGEGYAVDTDELTINPNGESASFNVTFDAAEVDNLTGTYDGVLTVLTNDPNRRESVVNLTVDVDALGPQDIDLIGAAFAFGNVAVGTTQTRTLTVRNQGGIDLEGEVSIDGDAALSISEGQGTFILAGGESLDVTIEFTPADEEDYAATVTISSDDPNDPTLTVPLTGAGTSGEEVLVQTDDDGNNVLDDEGNPVILKGDFDGNGDIGFQDFFIFADHFGEVEADEGFVPATDIDNSGDVGFQDFFIFADNFGKSGEYQVLGLIDGSDGDDG